MMGPSRIHQKNFSLQAGEKGIRSGGSAGGDGALECVKEGGSLASPLGQGGSPWRWRVVNGSSLEPEVLLRAVLLGGLESGVQLIRENMVRRILRVQIPPNPPLVIKHYLPRGIGRRFLDSVRSPQWERECRTALKLLEMEVPAPRPLFVAERKKFFLPAEGILATAEIVGGSTLKEFLEKGGSISEGLLWRLAGFLADLHGKRIHHMDLHWDNVMVGEYDQKLWLLDLHRVKVGFNFDKKRRIWNLAQLLSSMGTYLDPPLRREFLREYLDLASIPDPVDQWEREITRIHQEMCRTHEISRTKRCLHESSSFDKYNWGGFRIIRTREVPREVLAKVLRSAKEDGSQCIKIDTKVRVRVEIVQMPEGPLPLCVKEFMPRMTWKTIPLFRSKRRAERFWLGAWGLRARGLPAPACYGMWRPNLLSRAATSGVIMEMVPGESLRDLLLTMGDKRDALRPVSLKLAQLLAKMHDKGVFHRDLKASNLLVGQVQGREEIFLMDLEDVRFEKRVSVKEVIRNLTQLDQSSPRWVSRFTKLRFLATYLGARSKGRELDELLGVLRSGKNTER